jgi:hypothetical protein
VSLTALKQQLASVLDAPRPAEGGLATGIAALDAALSGGGIPRGRLTEVAGVRGSGKTTLLRQVVEATVRAGGWVGYVDATRTLAPRDWSRLSARGTSSVVSSTRDGRSAPRSRAHTRRTAEAGGLWVTRPVMPSQGAWCADVLLRSGAFTLVVLDGAPPLSRAVAVRLTRLARQANAAFVVTGDHAPLTLLPGALRLELARRARRGAVTVAKGGRGGQHRTVEVVYAVNVARRLCAHSEIPDRRGVARVQAPSRSGRAAPAPAGVLARKRRCAEPPSIAGRLARRRRDHAQLETCC